MSIFAVGDLHLPGQSDKPMDVFGAHWERHFEKIQAHWRATVGAQDIVLIPGDISWAMQMEDAVADLESIAELPGRKILLKGNHDYWWSSISKVRNRLSPGMYAIQNDALTLDDVVFCGTRGWTLPTESAPLDEQEQKILNREVGRLKISLSCAAKQAQGNPVVAMMHFPPILADGEETVFSDILEEAGVSDVVYGHLHGVGIKNGFTGMHGGVRYHLVSCDAIGFAPMLLEKL